jgi:hypothetical protein
MKAIKDILGIEYHVYVIEFQKRGLPHAHIVVKVSFKFMRTPSPS